MTPNVIRAELIAQYRTLEYNGYVQDAAAFAQTLLVERNSSNTKRIDVLWTGTLIDQLEIFALLNQWRRADRGLRGFMGDTTNRPPVLHTLPSTV